MTGKRARKLMMAGSCIVVAIRVNGVLVSVGKEPYMIRVPRDVANEFLKNNPNLPRDLLTDYVIDTATREVCGSLMDGLMGNDLFADATMSLDRPLEIPARLWVMAPWSYDLFKSYQEFFYVLNVEVPAAAIRGGKDDA